MENKIKIISIINSFINKDLINWCILEKEWEYFKIKKSKQEVIKKSPYLQAVFNGEFCLIEKDWKEYLSEINSFNVIWNYDVFSLINFINRKEEFFIKIDDDNISFLKDDKVIFYIRNITPLSYSFNDDIRILNYLLNN